jgi:predicted DCC family thiol-disulfide oxidoreductase YuxK
LKLSNSDLIVVIYDGECRFCRASVEWLQQYLQVDAQPFQTIDTNIYGLTKLQCAEQVYAIAGSSVFGGASAIAYLLKARGNVILSKLIIGSGIFGRASYKWISRNRSSYFVKFLTKVLEGSNYRFTRKREGKN